MKEEARPGRSVANQIKTGREIPPRPADHALRRVMAKSAVPRGSGPSRRLLGQAVDDVGHVEEGYAELVVDLDENGDIGDDSRTALDVTA